MRTAVGFATALALVCAVAADMGGDFDLITFAAQRWQVKTTAAQGTDSVTGAESVELALSRSFHFGNQLLGTVVVGAENTTVQVRLEGRDRTTATLHIGVLGEPEGEGMAPSSTPLAQMRITVTEAGSSGSAARVAAGTFRRLEAELPVADLPAAAAAIVMAKSGGFQLSLPNDHTFVMSFTAAGAAGSEPFLTIAGAGDAEKPAMTLWERFGPSGAMFAMFFIMRVFQGFVDSRQEQKEVVRRTMVAGRKK